MFSIYCKNKTEVLNLIRKLPQINIKSVLMINIERNTTPNYQDNKYIINMLCEIKIQIDYMVKAIKEKVQNNNPIQYYFCNYLNEIEN
jgi:hypothetical protein